MSAEELKAISRREIEAFNTGNLAILDEIAADDYVSYDPSLPEPIRGKEAYKQVVAGYRAAFPDLQLTIDQQVAEGDTVATRWTARGTHEGELMGIAPTGKQATVTGISLVRIADGKIVEDWTNWDALGLMQQLGAIAVPAHA